MFMANQREDMCMDQRKIKITELNENTQGVVLPPVIRKKVVDAWPCTWGRPGSTCNSVDKLGRGTEPKKRVHEKTIVSRKKG